MIVTTEINIRVKPPNIKYYKDLGYNVLIGENILIPINHLKKSSNIKILVSCDECGLIKECIYNAYNRQIERSSDSKYRCIKCSIPHKMRLKYGVDHYSKTDEFKNKYKETCLLKYGGHFNKLEISKQKIKSTNREKYGFDYPTQDLVVKNKQKDTNLYRYGYYCPLQNEDISNKSNSTMNVRYGSTYSMQVESIKSKIIDSSKLTKIKNILLNNNDIININYSKNLYTAYCNRCEGEYEISPHMYIMRKKYNVTICTNCNNIGKSGKEIDLLDFIKDNYDKEFIFNTRKIISPYELDLYLPDIKLGIEFNGLYWHSDIYKEKNYHLDKTNLCINNGIQLFHIWEDDWIYKQGIVKSMILNKLGKTPNKIFARKTEIKEINYNKIIRDFLNKNHIQGFIGSKIKLGLFYNDELVSLMTFGELRKSLGQSDKKGSYELLRFCNKLNTSVVGGASKLFKYFINNFEFNEITSYADRSISNGNLYVSLGFNFEKYTSPNYYYIIDGVRKHRFGFRKDKLVKEGFDLTKTEIQIMSERKINRIYNSGNIKFIYTL